MIKNDRKKNYDIDNWDVKLNKLGSNILRPVIP